MRLRPPRPSNLIRVMPAQGDWSAALLISRLHLVTDTHDGRDPLPDVEAALRAGVGWVQVRAKGRTDRDLLALTEAVVARAAALSATVVVDDRADIALAAGAHGVHLGADDLPIEEVRRILGPDRVIGATSRDPQTARSAVAAGADYVGVGPAFASTTKAGLPQPLGTTGVARVAAAVDVPVIAIAGIDATRVAELRQHGVHGVAVVSAISRAVDPGAAAAQLLEALDAVA